MTPAKPSKRPPADAARAMTTAESAVAALIAHGIKTIYALPGVHNDPLFDALFKAGDRIRTLHPRSQPESRRPTRWCRARDCSIPRRRC
jgi:acetolactate synthase-1/2/3 large subunit